MQAFDPFFQFVTYILFLPWSVWKRVSETIRTTISLNGYTAVDPNGVLGEEKDTQDEKEEGETKEES